MPQRVKMRWWRSRRRGSENKPPGSRHLHFRQTFPPIPMMFRCQFGARNRMRSRAISVAAAITFGSAALFFYLEPYPVSALCCMMIGP
jgi:hypothetical protein